MWYLKKLIQKAVALFTRAYRHFLRLFFRFDKWHTISLYEKKYAADIVRYLNARPKNYRSELVEIGCGLGDIVRRVHYKHKTGYDTDQTTLKAARFLSALGFTHRIDFELFHFPDSPLPVKADIIIMVNWIHHITPGLLKSKIEHYFLNNLLPGGEIIIDTVQDKEYKFNHDIGYLSKNINATITKLGSYDRQREIWVIKNG